ncbi:TonB-dependent receptor [Marinoscillum sp. MHG1-6]|uniref:TonB-dependent receptor n=1 Tax=Marinoscillum sp. MHG1-6 TaxID=2959627 RepID=UPI0021578DD5|nr:TonB-dependent receptor [Marinoscillum sp. MHG1-6]
MKTITSIFTLLISLSVYSKEFTQTIRGTILDQDTQMPLIGATVQVIDSDPLIGAITDINGTFRIEKVPVGRASLFITFIGYEQKVIPNILITSAKEVILNIEIQESVEDLDEVVVTAQKSKDEVLNEMAMISARTFSVEETQRYAGAISDPARMVSAFAGVTGNQEGNNDIVVRGNSSKGILWKLEGIEIPNPNHFANEGTTGGPVNSLNSNMLSNSDFFSGAFAPEYGNALSGVFDMKFKKGNNEQREYTTSASVFGIDFTAEGPFAKNYNGSYIVNYRYSSLQLLSDMGVLDFGGVPKYQDASFKVDLPINKKNYISVFGLGGLSGISVEEDDDEGRRIYRGQMDAGLAVLGVNYTHFINDQAFVRSFVSTSGTILDEESDLPEGDASYFNYHNSKITKSATRLGSTFNYKFNAKHKIEVGAILSHQTFDAVINLLDFETDMMENLLDDDGNANVTQTFTTWKYRMNENWTMITGFHYLYYDLNKTQSFEPRLGFRYQINEKQSVNFGAGIHSKLEPISIYLSKSTDGLGNTILPNKDLKPGKAAHFVVGYDRSLGSNTHFKLETYYQQLYDVPIENVSGSTYSLLNETDYFEYVPLENKGTGRNYGAEFTLERFFNKGFYYMSTLSLYESFYTPKDGIERKTAFDGNYVFNVLAGKEFAIGDPAKSRVLFLNTKTSLIGGSRYTPIDVAESRRIGTEVRDETDPFGKKGDDIFFVNFSIGTRRNKANRTSEFKIDITNLTNNQGTVNEYFIEATGEIEKSTQLPFLPNIVYTLKF